MLPTILIGRYIMNIREISESELLQMADDMVANFTSMNAQNYVQFIECRDSYKRKIHDLIHNIYKLKEDILEEHEHQYKLFRQNLLEFCDGEYKRTQNALEKSCT